MMAVVHPASQPSTTSGHRETLNGNSGKRKRTGVSIGTTSRFTESAPAATSRAAIGGTKGGKGPRKRSSERSFGKGRQNSLRRVPGSTDRLRDRSNRNITSGGIQGGREGRQFTVANVGNNGKIYLRYAKLILLWSNWAISRI